MKRSVLVLALLVLLVLVVVAIPVAAEHEDLEPHPHMLLQRPEFGLIDGHPFLVGVRQCVDLANNQPVPLHAHHERLHFGTSGISFGGESGHAVIPAGWFPNQHHPLPWADCEGFLAFLPLPVGE